MENLTEMLERILPEREKLRDDFLEPDGIMCFRINGIIYSIRHVQGWRWLRYLEFYSSNNLQSIRFRIPLIFNNYVVSDIKECMNKTIKIWQLAPGSFIKYFQSITLHTDRKIIKALIE